MSKFQEDLQTGAFLVTVEACPPKGVETRGFLQTLEALAGKVHAVVLPEGRGARIHLGPLAASLMAREKGLEPILTVTCRDRNRLSLCSDLLGAHALGLQNLLCVSGDYFHFGDVPDARPVYDLDSVQTIQMIREMEQGKDAGGNDLDGSPGFCVGAVANPLAEPLGPQLLKVQKKQMAGAQFLLTLDIFDFEAAQPFFAALPDPKIPILAGVRLITDQDLDLAARGKLPGNPIPADFQKEMAGMTDEAERLAKARGRMVEMIRTLRGSGLCQGVHLTLDGHEQLVPDILKEAGL